MSETHETTGSDSRESHRVDGSGLTFTLADEQRQLRAEVQRTTADRTAKTLSKTDNLRVTLIQLQAGSTLEPSAAAGAASLYVVDGQVSIEDHGQERHLASGQLLILPDNMREPLHADGDSTLLLTVAWDPGAGAWDQEETSGHN